MRMYSGILEGLSGLYVGRVMEREAALRRKIVVFYVCRRTMLGPEAWVEIRLQLVTRNRVGLCMLSECLSRTAWSFGVPSLTLCRPNANPCLAPLILGITFVTLCHCISSTHLISLFIYPVPSDFHHNMMLSLARIKRVQTQIHMTPGLVNQHDLLDLPTAMKPKKLQSTLESR